jgi:O-antigen/teichoic acid export membrane protein
VSTRIGRALVHSTAGTAVTRLLGALGGICVARLLAPAARGDLAVLVVLASIGSLVGAAGLQFWIARDVAHRGTITPDAFAVVRRHTIVVTGIGVVLAIGAAITSGIADLALAVPLAAIAFGTSGAVAYVWLALPNGARAMGVVSGAMVAGSAVYLGGTLVLLAADHPSLVAILLAATAGNLVSIAWAAAYDSRQRDLVTTAAPEPGVSWSGALRFGAAGGLGELVLFGMLRIDFLLVALVLPARDVGIYAVATALTEMLWVIPDGTAQIALPSAAASDGDVLPAVFRVSLSATILAGLLLSVFASPLLRLLFGPAYAAGAVAVPLLAVAAVAGGAWKMLAADLSARHSTHDRLVSAVVGTVVMVAADLVLIPALGIRGAAAGAAVGYVAAAVVVLRAWCTVTGRSPHALLGFRTGDLDVLRHRGTVSVHAEGSR